jgi:small subunit ribosomal protein S1
MSEEQKPENVEQATPEVAHEDQASAASKEEATTETTPDTTETPEEKKADEVKEEIKEEESSAEKTTEATSSDEEKEAVSEEKNEVSDVGTPVSDDSVPVKGEEKVEETSADSSSENAENQKAEEKNVKKEPVEDTSEKDGKESDSANKKEDKPSPDAPIKKEVPEAAPKEIPGEFDWDSLSDKGFGEEYTGKEKQDLAKLYESTLNKVEEKQVIKGVVVGVTKKDVILNIGYKSDGLVSLSEFKEKDLKEGDEVEVYLETQEDKDGQIVLSRRKANIVNAWESIKNASEQDTVIEGFVKRRTKGGLIIDVFGIEAFLPGSQIDVKPIRDFDVFVGKNMEVKVVKINYANDNVVVSHKVLIEKDIEKQKIEILNNLEKGQVLEGIVKNMTNFGVFIDLGGVDGLLHITDISWGRINHPEEVLKLDESVQVVVLDFDDEKKRISLGMKQLSDHPWDSIPKDMEAGSKVKGKIVNVADYGAFLEIMSGVEGLIHVSEMSWSQHLRNPSDFINVGDEVDAVVISMDREERKMSLGIKQLTEDPWTKPEILQKYAVGTKHKGIVRNMTHYGLFLELEEGIDGLVHVSDLSWTRKVKHPSEFVNVGEDLEVIVMELDVESRRLALSHKHIEENPWDAFEGVFSVGSTQKGTILEINEKGARIELQYGIEGFVGLKHLAKEDGSKSQVGDSMDLVVLEFNKDERRILLSHTKTWKTVEEAEVTAKKKGRKTSQAVKKVNFEVEKTTLGELDALSGLKKKMEEKAKEGAAAASEEAPKAKAEPKASSSATASADKKADPDKGVEEKASGKEEPKSEDKAKAEPKSAAKEEEAKESPAAKKTSAKKAAPKKATPKAKAEKEEKEEPKK